MTREVSKRYLDGMVLERLERIIQEAYHENPVARNVVGLSTLIICIADLRNDAIQAAYKEGYVITK